MTLQIVQCFCCFHEWTTKQDRPKRCPNCGSHTWDGRKIRDKYSFSNIEIGEKVLLPWYRDTRGLPDVRQNRKMNIALASFSCRTKRKFLKRPLPQGLQIIRVS